MAPSLTPAGTLTWYRLVWRTRPWPWQVGQGDSITVPAPPQRSHGSDSEKKPWLRLLTPRPRHSGQIVGEVPGCAPLPLQVAHVTGFSTGIVSCAPRSASANESVTSVCRSEPRLIAAPAASRALAAAPPAPEQPAEDVVEVDAAAPSGTSRVEAEAAGAARAGVADEVVVLALLGIGEGLVGDRDLLEAVLGRLVAGVAVRVVLARELAVGLLDVGLGRVLGHAERR